MGVIITFHALSRQENLAIVNWISLSAIIGIGSALFQNSIIVKNLKPMVVSFTNVGVEVQQAMSFIKVFEGDGFMLYWLTIGIWFFVVSFLARDNVLIPSLLIFLGYAISFSALINVFSIIINNDFLYIFSWLCLSIVLPIWGIREGVFLRSIIQDNE